MVEVQFVYGLILLLLGAPIVELIHKGQDPGVQATTPIMPWKVGIFYTNNTTGTNPKYMCTGSILGAHWILTAAHCIRASFRNLTSESRDKKDKKRALEDEKIIRPENGEDKGVIITISYGSNNLPVFDSSPGRSFKGDKVSVKAVLDQTVFVHDEYKWDNSRTSDNDVGLIYIPKEMKLGEGFACTAPLDLSADPPPLPGNKFRIRVAGWGRTEADKLIRTAPKPAKFANHLSYADIDGFPGPTCNSHFPQDNIALENGIQDDVLKQKIMTALSDVRVSLSENKTRFCGNDPNQNGDPFRAGACKGDSGGSVDLIVGDKKGEGSAKSCCTFRTIGLVSKGFGCGDKNYPDIYQLLTAEDFVWIKETDARIRPGDPHQELQVPPPETREEQHNALLQEFSTPQNIADNNREHRCRCVIC